jgi:hypothetical protein
MAAEKPIVTNLNFAALLKTPGRHAVQGYARGGRLGAGVCGVSSSGASISSANFSISFSSAMR